MTPQVSQSEDVGSVVADEDAATDQQQNLSSISTVPGTSRHQILAAQYECYLKIIHEPPRIDEGDVQFSIN